MGAIFFKKKVSNKSKEGRNWRAQKKTEIDGFSPDLVRIKMSVKAELLKHTIRLQLENKTLFQSLTIQLKSEIVH